MSFEDRLDSIVARSEELSDSLSGKYELGNDDLVRYSREYSEIYERQS